MPTNNPSQESAGLLTRSETESRERDYLAVWATCSGDSLGRLYPEAEHSYRTAFQRDRDRLIHSTAFRRLEYKTQVFVNHEGDYFRTRLTHTLEVVQIARSLGRMLRTNEDLVEAMALAHDLGHTPFGHAVEGELAELLVNHGGFEHNAQGLRCVDLLEAPYMAYPGLNLTHEVRLIFTKHYSLADLMKMGFANPLSTKLSECQHSPIVEAQVVDLSDGIAYNSHDVDDGIKSGLLSPEGLCEVPLWRSIWQNIDYADQSVQRRAAIRALINRQITDAAETSLKILQTTMPCATDTKQAKDYPCLEQQPRLVSFSPEMQTLNQQLKDYLHLNLYSHPLVQRKMHKAKEMIRKLFAYYSESPDQMAPQFALRAKTAPVERVVSDYIAGMTDRFAEEEYVSIFFPDSARTSFH